jgi:hypothetical protein
VRLVSQRSERKFTSHNHTQAWRFYSARPRQGAKTPEEGLLHLSPRAR